MLPLLSLFGGCEPQVYDRGALWLGPAGGGPDTGVPADIRPGRGTGGRSGQLLGSGGRGEANAGESGRIDGSGGSGAGLRTGMSADAVGGDATGGAVKIGGAGGVVVPAGIATGGTGTGGSGTGGSGTGGSSTGGSGTGGSGTGGSSTGGAAAASDTTNYNFESSFQPWTSAEDGPVLTHIARTKAQQFAGSTSLAGSINAVTGQTYGLEVSPPSPSISAADVVTFHVFVPSSPLLAFVQPYVQEGSPGFKFTGAWVAGADIQRNAWNTFKLTVPSNSATIVRMGVQFGSSGSWTDTVYIDAVDW